MSIKLSASIQMHPSREEFLPYLQERLGENTPVAMDTISSVWDTNRRAWLLHDPAADYHVVIQDDAIVCKDFFARAEKFIEKMEAEHGGEKIFSFYFGNRKSDFEYAKAALKTGFITRTIPTWGVAICLPTKFIIPMLKVCDTFHHKQDDVRIGKYFFQKKIPTYFPMPSLVDHRTDDAPSIVGDPGLNRKAFKFIDNI